MESTSALRVVSRAKVNLALSVGAPRPSGFHRIASWMVAVTFADRLSIERLDGRTSDFRIECATDAPWPFEIDWPREKDLAVRAHEMMEKRLGGVRGSRGSLPVRIRIEKKIPPGAGLGGGSSNAAVTLLALRQLFDPSLPLMALQELAGALGSDVAFALVAAMGRNSALVSGLGEQIEPVVLNQDIHLVLIFPGFGCPTRDVYQSFDRMIQRSSNREPDIARVRNLMNKCPIPNDAPFNDLAEAACAVRPDLGQIRKSLQDELNLTIHVTGSGSCLFVFATDSADANQIAKKVQTVSGMKAVSTRVVREEGSG